MVIVYFLSPKYWLFLLRRLSKIIQLLPFHDLTPKFNVILWRREKILSTKNVKTYCMFEIYTYLCAKLE